MCRVLSIQQEEHWTNTSCLGTTPESLGVELVKLPVANAYPGLGAAPAYGAITTLSAIAAQILMVELGKAQYVAAMLWQV